MAGETPASLQNKAGLPECQKVKRPPLALQFATGTHPAVLTCVHTHGTRAHATHKHAHGSWAHMAMGHAPRPGTERCVQLGSVSGWSLAVRLLRRKRVWPLRPLGRGGDGGQLTAASKKGHGPLDASSNRTFLRGDRGGDSLCRGSGGGVRCGRDVIVYTSRGFAFFFCWEQVQSYQTWMSQAQADSGPAAPLGWMAESALGYSLPSAGSEGATSLAPSATAGWRPPAWPGPPGCGRGASLGRWVFSLGGVLAQQDVRAQARGPCPGPMLAREGVRSPVRAFLDWGLWAIRGLWGLPALLALVVGSVPFPPSRARHMVLWGCLSALWLVSGSKSPRPVGGPCSLASESGSRAAGWCFPPVSGLGWWVGGAGG